MKAYINIYLSKNSGSLNAEFPGRIYFKMKNNGVWQNNYVSGIQNPYVYNVGNLKFYF